MLLQNSVIGCATKGMTPSPIRNFPREMASFVASKATTYLAFIVESTMQDFFTLLQLAVT